MEFNNTVHVLFVLVCAFSIVTSRKSEHHHDQQSDQPDANKNSHHNNGDIMKKLQELERNQGLTDGNVARLEHIIEAQAKLIQAQSEELHHLETVVKKEADRMKHVFHVSRENRHRAFLLGKILKQNNLTDEDFTLGKHNHGHQQIDRQGNGDRKNNRPNPANRQHNHNNHHQQQEEEDNRQEQKPHNHNQKQESEENQQHHHHHKQQKDDNDQSQQHHHHHKQQDSAESVSPTRHEHNPHSSSEINGKQDVTSNKDTNDKRDDRDDWYT